MTMIEAILNDDFKSFKELFNATLEARLKERMEGVRAEAVKNMGYDVVSEAKCKDEDCDGEDPKDEPKDGEKDEPKDGEKVIAEKDKVKKESCDEPKESPKDGDKDEDDLDECDKKKVVKEDSDEDCDCDGEKKRERKHGEDEDGDEDSDGDHDEDDEDEDEDEDDDDLDESKKKSK